MEPQVPAVDATVERVFRRDSGRAVATLTRLVGDLGVAEECVQEAYVAALHHWPRTGVPPNPAGWILTTARRRAIDRFRRDSLRHDKHAQAELMRDPDAAGSADGADQEVSGVADDRLRLVFTCCHPSLARATQVALTLRLVAGLQTAEIARAFLVPEPTMAQRLVRAKAKIKAARIPYRVPGDAELPDRLPPVLQVIYLVFNEGYVASAGDRLVRESLCEEAIRLARLVHDLMPDEPEVTGLLALLLLTHARRGARAAADGGLVRLAEQDRRDWDAVAIAEGHELVRACLRRNTPGPYQLQAAIAAVHADAATAADTDWAQIVLLYDHLLALTGSGVVATNRAVAIAELDGPAAALASLDRLDLTGYYLWHAARADALARLGRHDEAVSAYDDALRRTDNAVEQRFLRRRRDESAATSAAPPAADAGRSSPPWDQSR
ncbi:MAG: RNA polymerase sigma factor [Actinomycetota bacterium]|nr:MAG: RNA polymerase sigma factor [Actinomycetota bacterium]